MAEYIRLNRPRTLPIFKFFTSYLNFCKIKLAKGNPAKSDGTILFSHGRTGTPFIYSTILKDLARSWRILAPQHSEVSRTPYTDIKLIKKFR